MDNSDTKSNKIASFAEWQNLSDTEKANFTYEDLANFSFVERIKIPPDERMRLVQEHLAREKAERDADFERMKKELAEPQSGDSLVIHGKDYECPCNADRMWLCFDIYDKDFTKIQPQFLPPLYDVRRRWKMVEERKDDSIQFKARFYQPKSGDCEPTLIFRGTVGEFAGFGVNFQLTVGDWTLLDYTYAPDKQDKDMMTDGNYKTKVLTTEDVYVDLVGAGGWLSPGILMTDKIQEEACDLFDWLFPSKHATPRYEKIERMRSVPCKLKITIGACDRTCWGANIKQALGMGSKQYKKAAKFGMDIAAKIDAANKAKRGTGEPQTVLYLAAHSLGGGLAACAAHWICAKYHDLDVYGITYNSSGLNYNSVPRGSFGAPAFFREYVRDEILTTVQCFQDRIPFLGRLLWLLHTALPEPYGVACGMGHQALHPHPVMDDLMSGGKDRYAPRQEMDALPKLTPINEQTYIPNQKFPIIMALDEQLKKAMSLQNALGITVSFLAKYLKTSVLRSSESDDWSALKAEFKDLIKIAEAMMDYHGMDVVAESIFMPAYKAGQEKEEKRRFLRL